MTNYDLDIGNTVALAEIEARDAFGDANQNGFGNLRFKTAAGDEPETAVVVTHERRVGIGTETPACRLEVAGDTCVHGDLCVSGSVHATSFIGRDMFVPMCSPRYRLFRNTWVELGRILCDCPSTAMRAVIVQSTAIEVVVRVIESVTNVVVAQVNLFDLVNGTLASIEWNPSYVPASTPPCIFDVQAKRTPGGPSGRVRARIVGVRYRLLQCAPLTIWIPVACKRTRLRLGSSGTSWRLVASMAREVCSTPAEVAVRVEGGSGITDVEFKVLEVDTNAVLGTAIVQGPLDRIQLDPPPPQSGPNDTADRLVEVHARRVGINRAVSVAVAGVSMRIVAKVL